MLLTGITARQQQHWWERKERDKNPSHRGDEEYNYFLAVIFPDNQLKILDYNRVIRDLNGQTAEQLIARLE